MAASIAPLLSYTDARKQFKGALDRAEIGLPVGVHRGRTDVAFVGLEPYLEILRSGPAVPRPEVVEEAGGWSMFLPGVPVAADGETLDEALEEFLIALREYAADWEDRLRQAPNHRGNWALVQLVEYSEDAELAAWATGQV